MKKLLLLAATALLSGCIAQSLHPLYTEKDLVFEPKLLGTWVPDEKKPEETWTFEKQDEKEYKLTITDDHWPTVLSARLCKVQTNLFLDLSLSEEGSNEIKDTGEYFLVLRPVHFFLRVRQIEPELKLSALDLDWLKKVVETNSTAIRHEIMDDKEILLTASTTELQSFFTKHADEKEAFHDIDPMTRQGNITGKQDSQPPSSKPEEKK